MLASPIPFQSHSIPPSQPATIFMNLAAPTCKRPPQLGLGTGDLSSRKGGLWDPHLNIQPPFAANFVQFYANCEWPQGGAGSVWVGEGEGGSIFVAMRELSSMWVPASQCGFLKASHTPACNPSPIALQGSPINSRGTQGKFWWTHAQFVTGT